MNKDIVRAAIYARYSSDNQRDASIDDQLRVCHEYADKHSIAVVREYCDHAITGRTENRPAYQQMLADAAGKSFSVVLVYSLDRLGRDMYALAFARQHLKKCGVSVCYVTQPLGEGAEATLMEAVLSGLAQYYSENLSRNIRRGHEGNALKCIFSGSIPPLGYIKDSAGHLVPDAITAPIVLEIFQAYADGQSVRSIVRSLNERGILTARKHPFTDNSLHHMLDNETYIGTFHWDDIRIENGVEPIISKELWEKVHSQLKLNKIKRSRTKSAADFILSGKAFCGNCGAMLIGDSGTSRRGQVHYYYSCTNHKHARANVPCCFHSMRKDELEQLCYATAKEQLTPDSIEEISEAAASLYNKELAKNDKTPRISAELKQAETKINNIMHAIELGVVTETTTARLRELEAQAASLRISLAKAQQPIKQASPAEFAFYLSQFAIGEDSEALRHQVLDIFVNSVTVTENADGQKEIVLVLNLKTNTTVKIGGSDLGGNTSECGSTSSTMMELSARQSNHRVYVTKRLAIIVFKYQRSA